MKENWAYNRFISWGFEAGMAESLSLVFNLVVLALIVATATFIVRKFLLSLAMGWIRGNKYTWDEPLVENRVFVKLSWFVPVLILHLSIDSLLPADTGTYIILKRIMKVFFAIVTIISANAVLSAVGDIYIRMRKDSRNVLQGFIDAAKIIIYIFGAIFIISIFSGVSPWGIISVLGGLTAVTLLIFKDTILGFVASVQLSSIDMVRVGDWVEMPSYGADGDVISISIHTVRVQNWDKTITTIPTYALISNAFKNWRGMSESGGRRIKRSLMIDIHTIMFCTDEMLERFKKYRLLEGYLKDKTREIDEHNRGIGVDDERPNPINGRAQTNIGIFRAYVIAYLKANPNINQGMTFLVRQLPPTELGLPLEIYVFSKEQRWAHYEAIQADIFDHLLAALPEFNLRAYQAPSGHDIAQLKKQ